ncbi:UDP-glucose 4-epimerase [Bacillus sp. OxB-1]|uniref:Wzz/FepE/Etk N-terminal domain-containing protein n=1 Tax=Bacillus sp. (strain OxB-1) TaxID=98228 RepID=UPI000581E673|nr:Wzz/FepE/Etk N-terminal domain-containing protein [Bacillus sp. OxB-1]BAQ08566.1 UDP-glucose 4-epimerase [Bacillus sp. OxB-1]
MDLRDLAQAIRKKLNRIIAIGILSLICGGLISYFLPPKYTAQTELLVNSSTGNNPSMSEIDTNIRLIETYKRIMKSDRMGSKLASALLGGAVAAQVFNVGNGAGFSVGEVIEVCEAITGRKADVKFEERRQGDPAYLVASNEKIKERLGWQPTYNLPDMIRTAWKWHSSLSDE